MVLFLFSGNTYWNVEMKGHSGSDLISNESKQVIHTCMHTHRECDKANRTICELPHLGWAYGSSSSLTSWLLCLKLHSKILKKLQGKPLQIPSSLILSIFEIFYHENKSLYQLQGWLSSTDYGLGKPRGYWGYEYEEAWFLVLSSQHPTLKIQFYYFICTELLFSDDKINFKSFWGKSYLKEVIK